MPPAKSYSALITRFGLAPVLEQLRAGAAERDVKRSHAFDAYDAIKASGFGAARLPSALGGADAPIDALFEAVVDLATADTSIAHAFRNHFALTEQALRRGPGDQLYQQVVPRVADRKAFAWAAGETAGGAQRFTGHRGGGDRQSPQITRDGDRRVLNGVTLYSTGNIYVDYLYVTAADENNAPAWVVLPTTRQGLSTPDDWDGIGQRGSGSGTTVFDNVVLEPGDFLELRTDGAAGPLPYSSSFVQLFLTAVVAGAASAALEDARHYVAGRKSNYYHGQHDRPADEVELQLAIGEISAEVFAIRSAVFTAARALEAASLLARAGVSADEETAARYQASLDCVRAKIFVDSAAHRVTSRVFDTFGGSAARVSTALDRHWRNARTVSLHNPGLYKARILGDYELNGTLMPSGLYF